MEGYQEKYTQFVKQLVNKPVVGVGRFTSPPAMVSQIKRGVLDLIGAARPSIADPFLPNKIANNEIESIRECIGCNICVASDNIVAPIRCTQNPTMGEEWKRGWHPEHADKAINQETVLVVGAGPAGLECSLQLAKQGYSVMLAEATDEVGGRLLNESSLPGLASYRRVSDYRRQLLSAMPNVDVLLGNRLSANDIVETGITNVVVATGSVWRKDAFGRQHPTGIAFEHEQAVLTPDDVYAGALDNVSGPVVIYDDDHYYLGGVLAEQLQDNNIATTLVTPASCVSAWTEHTLEQYKIQQRLIQKGVHIVTANALHDVQETSVVTTCVYSGTKTKIDANACVVVTSRKPIDSLYEELKQQKSSIKNLVKSGDCLAPSTVAAAVYSGHLAARQFLHDEERHLFRRETPLIVQ